MLGDRILKEIMKEKLDHFDEPSSNRSDVLIKKENFESNTYRERPCEAQDRRQQIQTQEGGLGNVLPSRPSRVKPTNTWIFYIELLEL